MAALSGHQDWVSQFDPLLSIAMQVPLLQRIELASAQGRRLSFDVSVSPRPVVSVPNRGVGPVYVIAVDADKLDNAGQASINSTTPEYTYTISGITAPRIVVVAGTDTDNDGFICSPSEPCGMYPILGASPTVLEVTPGSSWIGINFSLVSGGASAASVGASPKQFVPVRGFKRRVQ